MGQNGYLNLWRKVTLPTFFWAAFFLLSALFVNLGHCFTPALGYPSSRDFIQAIAGRTRKTPTILFFLLVFPAGRQLLIIRDEMITPIMKMEISPMGRPRHPPRSDCRRAYLPPVRSKLHFVAGLYIIAVVSALMGTEEARMYDRNLQHFSPEGRIYQVIYSIFER